MKRILFVISALETGGAEKSLVNLLNIIDSKKYQVDLLLFKKEGAFLEQVPSYVTLVDAPPDLYYLYNRPRKKEIKSYLIYLKRLIGTGYRRIFFESNFYQGMQVRWEKFYKKGMRMFPQKYDVAVSYMHGECMYYVAEKVDAKRKITWVHNDYKGTGLNAESDLKYFCKFDKVVSISDECVKIWKESFPQLQDRAVCIPNLTSSDVVRQMAKAYYPQEYKENKGKKIILSVGRLNEQKGFDIAIKIAAELSKRKLNYSWYVIGKGSLKSKLKEMAEEYGVSERFVLIGTRDNPYPYMYNADIIAQPSRYEGKSVVLDEAKILGKPIVVSNYSTVKDQIVPNKEGIISSLNIEAFSDAICKALQPDVASKLSSYLLDHEYGNAKEIKEYYKLFDDNNYANSNV